MVRVNSCSSLGTCRLLMHENLSRYTLNNQLQVLRHNHNVQCTARYSTSPDTPKHSQVQSKRWKRTTRFQSRIKTSTVSLVVSLITIWMSHAVVLDFHICINATFCCVHSHRAPSHSPARAEHGSVTVKYHIKTMTQWCHNGGTWWKGESWRQDRQFSVASSAGFIFKPNDNVLKSPFQAKSSYIVTVQYVHVWHYWHVVRK